MKYIKGLIHGWVLFFAIAGLVSSIEAVNKEES